MSEKCHQKTFPGRSKFQYRRAGSELVFVLSWIVTIGP
jgi:hypothetical protein